MILPRALNREQEHERAIVRAEMFREAVFLKFAET